MKRFTYLLLLAAFFGIGYVTFFGQEEIVDFSSQIKPIINKNCIACHGGVRKSGGLSFLFEEEALANTDAGHPAIIPGHPEDSPMIQRLKETDPELRMPYQKPPLTSKEITLLENWIRQGAHWGEHWAYIAPINTDVPVIAAAADVSSRDGDFFRNDIDRFIYHTMQEKDLTPESEADTGILLRRLYMDLIGLPPETSIFQTYRESKISYTEIVDQLLVNENFGEKWAAWWLDLARYADSKGYEADKTRDMWRYRDYVIRSLNADKPFDQFTIEQLAGDLLPEPTLEDMTATAFHRNTMANDEGGTDDEEFRVAAVVDRVNTTFAVWQSTTFECVQCHAHTYDPFKHEEYYEVMAFFNNSRDEDVWYDDPQLLFYPDSLIASIEEITQWIRKVTNDEDREKKELQFIRTLEPKYHGHSCTDFDKGELYGSWLLGLYDGGSCKLNNVDLTDANQLVIRYNGSKVGGRMTIREENEEGRIIADFPIQKTKGREIHFIPINPSIKPGAVNLHISFRNPALEPEQNSFIIEWFAFRKSLPGSDRPGYAKIKTKYRQLLRSDPDGLPVMVENPALMKRTTQVFDKGNWMSLGDTVTPDVPKVLNDFPEGAPRNRLGLARWLTDKSNPLTARTMVNRIWQQLFGQGLVTTVEDMGTQSEPTHHQELLDWLAYRFMHEHQWRLKSLIKDIVLSGTYRQASEISQDKRNIDPSNLYYARGPRFRLSAEQIRDQALAVSGLLSDKMYGPSVMPPQPEGVWQIPRSGAKWVASEGEDRYRRGVYTFIKRTSPYPSFISFDAGSREMCQIQRIRTNTPLQALVTLNDPVYIEAALSFAHRIMKQNASGTIKDNIQQAYFEATFRALNSTKAMALEKLYGETMDYFTENPDLMDLYLAQGQLDKFTENHLSLAAMSMVCSTILNLDEFLTKS